MPVTVRDLSLYALIASYQPGSLSVSVLSRDQVAYVAVGKHGVVEEREYQFLNLSLLAASLNIPIVLLCVFPGTIEMTSDYKNVHSTRANIPKLQHRIIKLSTGCLLQRTKKHEALVFQKERPDYRPASFCFSSL